ncbi:MAG: hypothetical protein HZLCBSQH_001333 [Candidatus Fervidibacterota bacterium]|jgi:hypothetical protein
MIAVRRSDCRWFVAAVVVTVVCVGLSHIKPQQPGLTQCLDQITDFNLCRKKTETERWCCVAYPVQNWRAAKCLIDVYEQLRPPPLPPSVYYTNRRLCGFPGDPCTPLVVLHCP